jgi:hypothetical protein
MGTTVAEPDQGIRMRHHLAHRRQRALRIIAERTIQDRAPIILQHPVVGQWRRVNGQPKGFSADTALRRRLIVRRIAEGEDAIPPA